MGMKRTKMFDTFTSRFWDPLGGGVWEIIENAIGLANTIMSQPGCLIFH